MVLMPLLKELKFFKSKQIEGNDILQVCQEIKYEYMSQGDYVFKFGDTGDKFYVILKGEVSVRIPDPK